MIPHPTLPVLCGSIKKNMDSLVEGMILFDQRGGGGGRGGGKRSWTKMVLPSVCAWTAGSLFGFSATSDPSTFLQALHNLMCGVENLSVPGLRARYHSSINSTATWMCHVLAPHVSCDKC